MNLLRGLALHLGLLVVAAVLAVMVWTKAETPAAVERAAVEVWPGAAASLSSIEFDGDKRKVRIEAHEDKGGRYFVVDVDKTIERHRTEPLMDAGAGDAGAKPEPAVETRHENQRFISIESGQKLAESLAPLRALRALGKIAPAQASDFGLDKTDGTVRVTIGGKQHTLVLGGSTPGGGDRYARVEETGEVYAIPGDVARSLQYAESRLMDRSLHEWKEGEVDRVRLTKGQSVRELVPVPGKHDQWADSAAPTKQDETAGNWISKLDRLRPTAYLESPVPPPGPASLVVRVTYSTGSRQLGYLELYKLPGDPSKADQDAVSASPAKPPVRYLAKTEYTRWYVEVPRTNAEQVEQDLASVLK